MPNDLTRGTASQRHAHLKRLAWKAKERGQYASWEFLRMHPDRDTFVRPALQHEYLDDGLHTFSPAIVIAQRDRFFADAHIVQRGLRGPSELAAYVSQDRGEEFARALRELARGDLHFSAGNFTVVKSRIVPANKP